MTRNKANRRHQRFVYFSLSILTIGLASGFAAGQALPWKHLADAVGNKTAEAVMAKSDQLGIQQFDYTDAKFGRYWLADQRKVVGSVDCFFYAQNRESRGYWGHKVPVGGGKVEAVFVLRLIPVGCAANGSIAIEVVADTFGAYDDFWGLGGGAGDRGFEYASAAKQGWAAEIATQKSMIVQTANAALGGLPIPVPLAPPSCDEYVFSLFSRLKGEIGSTHFPDSIKRGVHGPLAKLDLTRGRPIWGVILLFAEDRAIYCFRPIDGVNSFNGPDVRRKGGVRSWFEGACQKPGEWVAAIYLPEPRYGTPLQLQDLSGLSVNGKGWNDKVCDYVLLPGDAFEGSSIYLFEAGINDRYWNEQPDRWRLLQSGQGYHTVRTDTVIRGWIPGDNGSHQTKCRMANNVVSSIFLGRLPNAVMNKESRKGHNWWDRVALNRTP